MKIFIFSLLFLSSSTFAGGWSNWTSPTQIDMVGGDGIMVYGAFGNPSECTITNQFYLPKSHPEYDKIYGIILAAFSANKKLRVYSHSCGAVGWYSVETTTYNYVNSGAVNIKH